MTGLLFLLEERCSKVDEWILSEMLEGPATPLPNQTQQPPSPQWVPHPWLLSQGPPQELAFVVILP